MKIVIRELDPDIIPPSTRTMNNIEQGGSKIVIIGKPGTGKCLGRGTPILMHDGTVRPVESVVVGDRLMGDDSTPRLVLSVSRGSEDLYRVCQENGIDYVINGSHILTCYHLRSNQIVDVPVTVYREDPSMYLGIKTAVCLDRSEDVWDAYMIGFYFLLDHVSDIKEIDRFLSDHVSQTEPRIPESILYNTTRVRQDFLNGFFDSSSYDDETREHTILLSLDPCLFRDDLVFLCRITGYYVEEHVDRLVVRTDRLSRYSVYPIRVEPAGTGEYFGFEIDGNGRFLLSDTTITHNTTLITSLLYEKRHIFPIGMVMSGTEDSNGHYRKIFPASFVFNRLNEEKIEQFITRQKIAKQHVSNPWAILLLDDCTDDPKLFSKPLFQGLYKNGRHWKCWFILSLQYCMDVKPVIRTNVDGTFILREPSLRNRKALWENYAGIIPDFSMFCSIMDQITDNYTALYIHNATSSNQLEECLYWYKAKPVPSEFHIGCKDFWKFHHQRYDKNYRDPFI